MAYCGVLDISSKSLRADASAGPNCDLKGRHSLWQWNAIREMRSRDQDYRIRLLEALLLIKLSLATTPMPHRGPSHRSKYYYNSIPAISALAST
eukprot:scaffold236226_cov22-Tisochrysis_lutea.AAC.1